MRPIEIQPVVIGTAGHIDHGKSTLVRALTGIDPDRLPEEKARGLTIDLGFAPFTLPDGRKVGIVDVPGHERFVRNMVAGATGIDVVLLVVAADDGVMPQTREHLQIMQLLGLSTGLVALTKVDAVEPEMAELAAEDVRALLAGTFLERAPILPISALTGQGMDALRAELARLAAAAEPRSAEGVFRMPIQRVFSVKGFGTVVTGIPVSGSVGLGDVLEILPPAGAGAAPRGKVRGIQAYQSSVERARAGHSTALNLADVDSKAVQRGCVAAAPGYFRPLAMVAGRFSALPGLDAPLANRTQVRFHTGTFDGAGELWLLDAESLAPGAQALVQVRLQEPVVCAPGDRFLVRLLSPERTLGGGVILEESRWRLKRFKHYVIEELALAEQALGSPIAELEAALARRPRELASVEELEVEIKRPREETRALLAELARGRKVHSPGKSGRWMHAEALAKGLAAVREALAAHFRENPHRELVEVSALRERTGLAGELLEALLEEARARGELRLEPGGLVRAAARAAPADPKLEALAARAHALLAREPFAPPAQAELAPSLGAPEADVKKALQRLADTGRARRVDEGLWFAGEALERAKAAVAENCGKHGHLEIPELRDALGTSRKFLIPLLEWFDAQGFTVRQGGHRVLKRR
jgi:selenocysteine-specific elongation factor